MTERERLIELLKAADEDSARRCITDYNEAIADNADYLLANGVIVPPVKVGDSVYHVYKGDTIVNALVVGWEEEAFGDWIFWACLSMEGIPITLLFGDYNIGKTVFLTREEAEKALEGKV